MTDRQKYYHLMGEVCEQLPSDAVDKAVRAGHPTPAQQLVTVRQGRRSNLADLVALVRYSMPDFDIPDNLLPADRAAA